PGVARSHWYRDCRKSWVHIRDSSGTRRQWPSAKLSVYLGCSRRSARRRCALSELSDLRWRRPTIRRVVPASSQRRGDPGDTWADPGRGAEAIRGDRYLLHAIGADHGGGRALGIARLRRLPERTDLEWDGSRSAEDRHRTDRGGYRARAGG